MGKFQSTKIFDNYSIAIRQWRAQHSHCQLLHGYALEFKVWFEPVDKSKTYLKKSLQTLNHKMAVFN